MGTFARRDAIHLIFFLLAWRLALCPAAAWALSGLEIMQKQRELQRPKDETETLLIKLISKIGEVKERRVVIYALLDDSDLNKILIRVLAPRDVENTGLLIWEGQDGNDDEWLYFPATKKIKRIASSSKKKRFMGTDFAVEDLRPEPLAFHKYSLLGSETVGGQECYVIGAMPATEQRAADSDYSNQRIWVRKDIYLTVRREFYDKRGKLAKIETPRNLINIKGTYWRPDEVEMHDVQAGTRTVVTVENRAVDRGLKDSFFTEAQLTSGGP